ncbi:MAG TPA: adenosylmethionine--8-amino-7-oxononanoate transaminase, partial [Paenibacillaceae bacterium]|nr:adenosylmethionine--8-amino-7-oxononanoate transaminase [Paenibacillaceae bacterium]
MKEQLEQWDKEYLWHPFTQMKQYRQETPLIIERGKGSYLIDMDGNAYLDGYSSLWVNVHGHNHHELNEALRQQAEKIAHSTLLGSANIPSILLAKKLVEITPPGLNKVFYSDAGSTSVEIALKIAYQYWKLKDPIRYAQKNKFISLKEAYHGDTVGSVSVGGMDLYHKIFSPLL